MFFQTGRATDAGYFQRQHETVTGRVKTHQALAPINNCLSLDITEIASTIRLSKNDDEIINHFLNFKIKTGKLLIYPLRM